MDVRIRDLIEYLEYKVLSNLYNDDEYGLYIEYQNHGESVFDWEWDVCQALKEEYSGMCKGD